jgi:hypothetical protein
MATSPGVFAAHGLTLKRSWLSSRSPEDQSSAQSLLKAVIESDISSFSEPTGLSTHQHDKLFVVQRPIFLQVDEITDASLAREQREMLQLSPKGTLKLLLSDSECKFIGISKGPITGLNPASAPGLKLHLVPPVEMRYGVLFLSDARIHVHGGSSPLLLAQRLFVFHGEPKPPAVGSQFLNSSSDAEVDEEVLSQCEDDIVMDDSDSDIIELAAPRVAPGLKVCDLLNLGESEGYVETGARVTDVFDFKVGRRGDEQIFVLSCKLTDSTGNLIVGIDPDCLLHVLNQDVPTWVRLDPDEKAETYRMCKRFFCSVDPPLVLIDREPERANQGRFSLTLREFVL